MNCSDFSVKVMRHKKKIKSVENFGREVIRRHCGSPQRLKPKYFVQAYVVRLEVAPFPLGLSNRETFGCEVNRKNSKLEC